MAAEVIGIHVACEQQAGFEDGHIANDLDEVLKFHYSNLPSMASRCNGNVLNHLPLELTDVQVVVEPELVEQLLVRAAFDNPASLLTSIWSAPRIALRRLAMTKLGQSRRSDLVLSRDHGLLMKLAVGELLPAHALDEFKGLLGRNQDIQEVRFIAPHTGCPV